MVAFSWLASTRSDGSSLSSGTCVRVLRRCHWHGGAATDLRLPSGRLTLWGQDVSVDPSIPRGLLEPRWEGGAARWAVLLNQ